MTSAGWSTSMWWPVFSTTTTVADGDSAAQRWTPSVHAASSRASSAGVKGGVVVVRCGDDGHREVTEGADGLDCLEGAEGVESLGVEGLVVHDSAERLVGRD